MQLYFETLNYALLNILEENMLFKALIFSTTKVFKDSQTSYALP